MYQLEQFGQDRDIQFPTIVKLHIWHYMPKAGYLNMLRDVEHTALQRTSTPIGRRAPRPCAETNGRPPCRLRPEHTALDPA